MTATLHIEHAITDFEVWRAAFDRVAEKRRASGVMRHRVGRPVDDPHYVVIDLDFDTADHAASFLHFLQTQVWGSTHAAPALVGAPRTAVLEVVDIPSRQP